MKGLIIIHEIHPTQGSECRSGFFFLKELIQLNEDITLDVIIPTNNIFKTSNYYSEVKKELENLNILKKINLINVDHPNKNIFSSILKFLQAKNKGVGNVFLYYYLYNLWLKKVLTYITPYKYDFIHTYNHINIFSLVDFSNKTHKWYVGPVTGFSFVPSSFNPGFVEIIRKFIQFYSKFKLKALRSKIACLYVVSNIDYDYALKLGFKKIIRLPEQCYENNISNNNLNKQCNYLELVWIGDLVTRKQLDILLNSLINIDVNYHLNVLGDGPELKKLQSFSKQNNLNVDFLGRVTRDKVFHYLENSNLLIHTSYREGTATTLIEAVSFSNFVIAHNIGGHDLIINSSTGILIPLVSKNNSISRFREAIINANNNINSINSFKETDFQFNWKSMTSIIYKNYLHEI
jgi:hypothetical protein